MAETEARVYRARSQAAAMEGTRSVCASCLYSPVLAAPGTDRVALVAAQDGPVERCVVCGRPFVHRP
jgi:hypothetical protein